VATIIALNAIGLFPDNPSVLLGRSPGREYPARVEQAARSVDGVLALRELRAEYLGPDIVHAALHFTVEATHRIAEIVHARMQEATDGHYCVIQVGPVAVAR